MHTPQILIRPMNENDPIYFSAEECAQGWHSSPDKLNERLQHEKEGRCTTFVAEVNGVGAGYVSLYASPANGPFAGQNIPEIVDFNVLQKFQRQGIGTKLMEACEEAAAKVCDRVCLGVGLHAGYGSAQRMYVKRGYIPDGSGVWYGDHVCEPYTACENDDDLVLYMSKELK